LSCCLKINWHHKNEFIKIALFDRFNRRNFCSKKCVDETTGVFSIRDVTIKRAHTCTLPRVADAPVRQEDPGARWTRDSLPRVFSNRKRQDDGCDNSTFDSNERQARSFCNESSRAAGKQSLC